MPRSPVRLLALLALGFAPSVEAWAQLSDRLTERRLRRQHELHQPWAYKNAKERRARGEHGRSWAVLGAFASGLDSNIFESPGDETDSAIFDGIVQIDHVRYPTEQDRFHVRGVTTFRVHTASSKPDEVVARVFTGWRREHSQRLRYGIELDAKYENDDVVNTEGFSPERDFEHGQIGFEPHVEWQPARRHRLRLAYRGRYRDFVETSGLDPLDFWFHGPSLHYRYDATESLRFGIGYTLRHEVYDEVAARTSAGRFRARNPEEEHLFHRARIEGRWRPRAALAIDWAYEYVRKDDRFEGFESHDDHMLWARASIALRADVEASLTFAWQDRDFDHRPDGAGGELAYERFFVSPALRWAWSERWSLFSYYTFDDRDTNRDVGRDFRDERVHRWLSGVSFNF